MTNQTDERAMATIRGLDTVRILCAALTLGCVLAAPARAAVCAGIDLPDTIEREETLVLNGMGIRLATIFNFKVYVAGLYVPEPQSDAESIIAVDQPRVLVMVFLRDVSQRLMQSAILDAIEVNADRNLGPVKEKLGMVPEVLPEVREGQTLIFDYAPGYGTAVMLDGETIANLEGHDFAAGLMTLWIGVPPNDELKEGLLGGVCE
jgi:hypothetical protein